MATLAADGDRVPCLVQVVPQKDILELRHQLHAIGGTVGTWIEETRLLSVELEARRLEQLADIEGIAYIEARERFGV